jgi:16S rRNA (cytidine1402-2'-O)-methyltransferase
VAGAAERGPGEASPAALDAVAELVEAGAKARTAARVVAELTGEKANALYRAYLDRW